MGETLDEVRTAEPGHGEALGAAVAEALPIAAADRGRKALAALEYEREALLDETAKHRAAAARDEGLLEEQTGATSKRMAAHHDSLAERMASLEADKMAAEGALAEAELKVDGALRAQDRVRRPRGNTRRRTRAAASPRDPLLV